MSDFIYLFTHKKAAVYRHFDVYDSFFHLFIDDMRYKRRAFAYHVT